METAGFVFCHLVIFTGAGCCTAVANHQAFVCLPPVQTYLPLGETQSSCILPDKHNKPNASQANHVADSTFALYLLSKSSCFHDSLVLYPLDESGTEWLAVTQLWIYLSIVIHNLCHISHLLSLKFGKIWFGRFRGENVGMPLHLTLYKTVNILRILQSVVEKSPLHLSKSTNNTM